MGRLTLEYDRETKEGPRYDQDLKSATDVRRDIGGGLKSAKGSGRFYTDHEIVDFMLKSALDIAQADDPYVRILDPSCGCGYFLSAAYDMLYQKYSADIASLNRRFPGLKLSPENIHEHIIENNLFGADIDSEAVDMCIRSLSQKKAASSAVPNIICCDTLTDVGNGSAKDGGFWRRKFQIIVGNPPYVGHKNLDGSYRRLLQGIYGDIFRDKADISFCFFKISLDLLAPGGRLCFISSRYFMESPSGKALRDYIMRGCTVERIIDFYGVRIIRGVAVDPVIIIIRKREPLGGELLDVARAKPSLAGKSNDQVFDEIVKRDRSDFYFFAVPQRCLSSDGWVLCDAERTAIIERIKRRCDTELSRICTSFQGVITGCDRAFVVSRDDAERAGIEKRLLRPWIKNSCVKKYRVEHRADYLIYSDLIDDAAKYGNAIAYIGKYRDRLEKRRECERGVRAWYELQWGRDRTLFERKRILFPYKAPSNRFALDSGSFFSADVYGMYIDDAYAGRISYEFLSGLLNSRLYEFYFQSFAKKLGGDLYDYYPNTVMRLMVPLAIDESIEEGAKAILQSDHAEERSRIMTDIDNRVYSMFELSGEQIRYVERSGKG